MADISLNKFGIREYYLVLYVIFASDSVCVHFTLWINLLNILNFCYKTF